MSSRECALSDEIRLYWNKLTGEVRDYTLTEALQHTLQTGGGTIVQIPDTEMSRLLHEGVKEEAEPGPFVILDLDDVEIEWP